MSKANLSTEVFKHVTKKPDGRALQLYSRAPIDQSIVGTSPAPEALNPNPHMRWHPLRGEWVVYASHRQNRTFLPPKEYNPLAPTVSKDFPTELPHGQYDVAVFENLFPSLTSLAHSPPQLFVPTLPAHGACEVVVFTQDAEKSLGQLPLDHICLLLEVWSERYQEIGSRKEIKYVMPFENRGIEMGVTLNHPHGQIYAYPFIPPVAANELQINRKQFASTGKSILEHLIEQEKKDQLRMLFQSAYTSAFVPICARYPYEVWIAPERRVASLSDMTAEEKRDFARALKTVLLKYDGLWGRAFPYLMVLYQAPTDGEPHPESHFHIEFYPPFRTRDRLKFLAGTELGAGVFANDSVPEEKAAELRAVEVTGV